MAEMAQGKEQVLEQVQVAEVSKPESDQKPDQKNAAESQPDVSNPVEKSPLWKYLLTHSTELNNCEDLGRLKSWGDDLCTERNSAFLSSDKNAVDYIDSLLEILVGQYAASSKNATYLKIAELPTPVERMRKAAMTRVFQTIRVGETIVGKIPVLKIQESEKQIDISQIHAKYAELGADPNWGYLCDKLNVKFSAKIALALGITNLALVSDSGTMAHIQSQIAKGETPCSNTKVLEQMKEVVSAMIGGELPEGAGCVLSKDVKFTELTFCKASRKALTLATAKQKPFRQKMLEICYRVLTNSQYNLECSKIKGV